MDRVKDWWGAGKRQFVGLYNFDTVRRKIVNEDDIAFEYLKKGDIDYYLVTKAQRWVEGMAIDQIEKGWIQKQKMYMREPQVPNTIALNLKDPEGVLVKDGKRMEFDFIYIHPSSERIYTPLQESFRKHGVKMNLKLMQPSAWIKVSQDRDFQAVYANWSPTPFPNPRDSWHSETADKNDTTNVCNFKDPKVDALIEQYDAEFDLAKRIELMHQIDALIYEQTPYLLGWYTDNYRNLWWDKFGMPEWCSWASRDIRNTNYITW